MRTYPLLLLCCAALVAGCTNAPSFDLDNHIGICGAKRAQAAAECGVNYLEVSVTGTLIPEESEEAFALMKQWADSLSIPIYSANGFYPSDIVLTGPEAQTERAVNYGRTAIRRASELGMKVLVLGSGAARTIPDGFDRTEAENQFLELLKALAPDAEKYGIIIGIEPLRRRETNLINTVREGAQMARNTGSPAIGVIADFFHMASAGEGPDALIDCADKLVHCHIAEALSRTAPGVNGQNFVPYFQALKDIGYTGGISMECKWGDLEAELPIAVETLHAQIKSVK